MNPPVLRSRVPGPRSTWLAAAGLLVALVASCASAPKAADSELATRERGQAEITALHNRIADMRLELGLKPRPPRQFLRATTDKADAPAWTPAAEPTSPACQDVCDLAEHICAAKDDICRIAGEITGDTWAQDKCTDARASCGEAKKLCTDCK